MTLAEHVTSAICQIRQGEKIGRRGTPVISFWPMRTKWEKYGTAWETMGTDGDDLLESGMYVIPAILRLVYFRTGEQVCQLAYVVSPEVKVSIGSNPNEMAYREYLRARGVMPRQIF